MELPKNFVQLIRRIIFERTRKSVQEAYTIRVELGGSISDDYSFDANNFIKWGASLLGLYVLSDGSVSFPAISDALDHFNTVLMQDRFNVEALCYASLANTVLGCLGEDDEESTIYCFIEARHLMEKAIRKDGTNELCRQCLDIVLKTQKTFLEAHNPTAVLIKRIWHEVSSASSNEEHGSSETVIVVFESLIERLREAAIEKAHYIRARLDAAELPMSEASDEEESDEECNSSDVAEELENILLAKRREAETSYKKSPDADAQKTYMEAHKPALSEEIVVEVSSTAPDGEETPLCNSSDAVEDFDNCLLAGEKTAETYNKDGRDADTQKTYVEVHKPALSEETVDEASSTAPNREEIEEFISILRTQQFVAVTDWNFFEDGPEVDNQKSHTAVHEPTTSDLTMDDVSSTFSNEEQQNSFDTVVVELKDFVQFLIFEQFRKSAEATYAKDSLDADNLTQWGAAWLGLSLTKSSQDAVDNLNFAISKLEEALVINSDNADALCYISNAYAALFWLTSDISKSNCYFDLAKEYIKKAIDKDPAEATFSDSSTVTLSLMAAKKKFKKSRKQWDAFGEEVDY